MTTTLTRVQRMRERRLGLQNGLCHWCDEAFANIARQTKIAMAPKWMRGFI